MKKVILYFALATLVLSCAEAPKSTESSSSESTTSKETVFEKPLKTYVGYFEAEKINENAKSPSYSNKINVSINYLQDGHIKGYSIIAGNQQVFEGDYQLADGNFKVTAKEPGNDKHDGRFEFLLDTLGKKVTGKWFCFDTTIDVPIRSYTLEEKLFAYDPKAALPEGLVGVPFYNPKNENLDGGVGEVVTKDVLKFNPSVQALKKADIENMFKGDMEILRNSIYARHGYSFRNRKMRYIFDNYADWYIPMSLNVESQLTELEKKNIDLLKRFENHAEKYYDEFGR